MNSLEKIINWCVEKLRCCHGNQCICAVVQSNWQPEMLNNSNAIARAPICCIFLNHFHGCMMYVAAVWVEKARASWRASLHFVAIFLLPFLLCWQSSSQISFHSTKMWKWWNFIIYGSMSNSRCSTWMYHISLCAQVAAILKSYIFTRTYIVRIHRDALKYVG